MHRVRQSSDGWGGGLATDQAHGPADQGEDVLELGDLAAAVAPSVGPGRELEPLAEVVRDRHAQHHAGRRPVAGLVARDARRRPCTVTIAPPVAPSSRTTSRTRRSRASSGSISSSVSRSWAR